MNDFKNAYQSAMQDMAPLGMKECHIDASVCMDEGRHRRRMMKRMRRTVTASFSAMCVIFICGFGTVKAAEYIGNVIRVNQWGFESGDARTMARSEKTDGQGLLPEEAVKLALSEAGKEQTSAPEEVMTKQPQKISDMNEPSAASPETASVSLAETADVGNPDIVSPMSQAKQMTQPVQEGALPSAVQETAASDAGQMQPGETLGSQQTMAAAGNGQDGWECVQEDLEVVQTYPDLVQDKEKEEPEMKTYTTWEEFEKNEDIIFPQPSVSIGESVTATNISVCGAWAMVRYDVDHKVLWLERTDYSGTQGHTAAKVFPEGVCNERAYTTPAGYSYTLIDSVKTDEKDALQIHAAITVGSYEVFIDFTGYTEDDAKKIIDSIDVSAYE